MITQIPTQAARKSAQAGANNTLTPTQQDKLTSLLEAFAKEEGIDGKVYVGKRKAMLILPDPDA